MNQLSKETLRKIFLREIKLDFLEVLNLMGESDVSKFSHDDVCELCQQYSRGNPKIGRGPRDNSSKLIKPVVGAGVTRA